MRNGEILIDDDPINNDILFPRTHARGLVPRDFGSHPPGCYAAAQAVDITPIPRSEWSTRIKEMEATKSRISDIMLAASIPSLDQNGKGYCWAHSTTEAVIMLRALSNLPYVPLSAYAVACKIKNFRDEGGWGALSLDFLQKTGIPSEAFWPAQSMSRANDNPATWIDAAKHKVTEGFVDLSAAVYDRDLTFDQVMTLLLSRIPVVTDLNWWGHSVVACDPVEVEPGSFGTRDRNSWGNQYGDRGFFVLRGSKAVPDGAVAPRVTNASAA